MVLVRIFRRNIRDFLLDKKIHLSIGCAHEHTGNASCERGIGRVATLGRAFLHHGRVSLVVVACAHGCGAHSQLSTFAG